MFVRSEETEIVAKIFSDVLLEKPLKILPLIDKGFVNQVFIVETRNSKFIFRMNDTFSLDEYEKEIWASNQASEKGVPVPAILKIGLFEEKAFSIQAFIEGSEGRSLSGHKKFIWTKIGEYANRIHKIKVAGFGLNFCDLVEGNAVKAWLEHLNYNIESLNIDDRLRKLGVLNETQSEKIRNIFENLRLRKFEFGLNHGDLSLKNTIVDKKDSVYLIDWGSSEASIVPHHDLIQLLKMNMLENNPDNEEFGAFLDGYGLSGSEYNELLPELKGLSLLRAFDKLRWAIDRKLSNLEDYIFQSKETVKRFL